MAHTGSIEGVSDLLTAANAAAATVSKRTHLRLWCRGHSQKGWKLEPGIYRPPVMKDEKHRLLRERHLTQDFRVYSAGVRAGGESDEDLYFLQQHYRMPTRLLDWTSNPLAALYFATSDDPDKDGELFLMDAYQISHTQKAEKEFEGVATSRNKIFREAIRIISNWWQDETHFPEFILPVRPDHFDQRISRQHACFTFHVPSRPALTAAENRTLKSFTIPAASKASIQAELALLGINHFTVFGDLDRLAEWLKGAHQ